MSEEQEKVGETVENLAENQTVENTEIAETPAEIKKEIVAEKKEAKTETEFDWASFGKKHEVYSKNEREKLENAYTETLKSINEHEVIDGVVVGKNSREVIVNIGFKSDGVISLSELRYRNDLKVGDTIEVYVESQEDISGQL
ncbi:MAG: S1 RNA-binding domain-containing protein, partial [Bacteroidota bacterium]